MFSSPRRGRRKAFTGRESSQDSVCVLADLLFKAPRQSHGSVKDQGQSREEEAIPPEQRVPVAGGARRLLWRAAAAGAWSIPSWAQVAWGRFRSCRPEAVLKRASDRTDRACRTGSASGQSVCAGEEPGALIPRAEGVAPHLPAERSRSVPLGLSRLVVELLTADRGLEHQAAQGHGEDGHAASVISISAGAFGRRDR